MVKDTKMVGKTFNRWSVLYRGDNLYNRAAYVCRCNCGVEKLVNGNELRRGKSKGCPSCAKLDRVSYKGKPYNSYLEYAVYQSMKARCSNPKTEKYPNYGGRGIKVCDRWLKSFVHFMDDMGSRPSSSHSIERINNDEGYNPTNCEWATVKIQNSNRRPKASKHYSFNKARSNYKVTVKGKHVGYFDTIGECIVARDEYAKTNNIYIRIKDE